MLHSVAKIGVFALSLILCNMLRTTTLDGLPPVLLALALGMGIVTVYILLRFLIYIAFGYNFGDSTTVEIDPNDLS